MEIDANALYKAGGKSIKTASFKHCNQHFESNHLLETARVQNDIRSGTYKPREGTRFWINERGHTRYITSDSMVDKTVNHYLTDEHIRPAVTKYLIYDNGASRPGKGVSFTRRRLEEHLRQYYREHDTNIGYVLLLDFRHFYDSIDHARAKAAVHSFLEDETAKQIASTVIDHFDGEVGIDIGNQISQELGVLFPYRIDNYIKIVRGQKYAARYSDDIYIISDSKEELNDLRREISEMARAIGLEVHPSKTHIARIDKGFRFLQQMYILTDTGRVIVKINPKAITRERRKLKAYKRQLDAGTMTAEDVEASFKSWMCNQDKVMSNLQISNMLFLYFDLFGTLPEWPKRHHRLHRISQQLCISKEA